MKDYPKLLTDFYLKYNPDKVSEVSYLLTKYKGQEEALLKKLYEKYKIFDENPVEEKYDGNPSEMKIVEEKPAETNALTGTSADGIPEKKLSQEIKPEEGIYTELLTEKDISQEIIPQDGFSSGVLEDKEQPQEKIPAEEIPADAVKEEEQPHEINHEYEILSEEKPEEEMPQNKIFDTEIPVEEVPAYDQAHGIKTEAVIPPSLNPDEIRKEKGILDEIPKDMRELITAKLVPETSSAIHKTPPLKSKKRKVLPIIIILVVIALGILSLFYFFNRSKGGENNSAFGNGNEMQATTTLSDALKENNQGKSEIPDSLNKTGNMIEDSVISETLPQNPVKNVPAETRTKNRSEIHETEIPVADEFKDLTIYRIQILTSKKQRTDNQIIIEGKTYSTYEYLYNEIYCYSVGEFASKPPANEFKSICRKNGYPDAFIVTIKNNKRIM